MNTRTAQLHRQRGVAVITALLLTTLAVTIVASLFWQQQVQVRSIENQRLQLQKQWVLRGALDWAALILREDAKHSNLDDLTEPWAVPLAETRLDQYVENGRADDEMSDAALSGGISDAQARYNLTNLSQNGTVNPAEVAAFARLLVNANLNPALAQATADAMQQAQEAAKALEMKKSLEAAVTAQVPIFFSHEDDLLAVPGFNPPMLDRLKDFVIFLPRPTPVNVNTAPAEVLAAKIDGLSLSDANALIATRSTASFRDLADFVSRLPGGRSVPASDASVTTGYFLVDGKVRMNRAGLEVRALIERNGTSTRLVWIREL